MEIWKEKNAMPFIQAVMPQFRDADEDGLIGIRGCMRAFQDIHTWYMHSVNKGNDVLPETYGAVWVYTRYQIHLERKLDYSGPAALTAWIEPQKSSIRVLANMEIRQNGVLMAQGRLESCVVSLEKRMPLRLQAVDFPSDMAEDIPHGIPEFRKLRKDAEGMQTRYFRAVRVSDLDKSRHMTNLRYIEMFQDAYDSAFWEAFQPKEMEIRFLSQCVEGEHLTVRSREEENAVYLAALHEDETVASVAVFAR